MQESGSERQGRARGRVERGSSGRAAAHQLVAPRPRRRSSARACTGSAMSCPAGATRGLLLAGPVQTSQAPDRLTDLSLRSPLRQRGASGRPAKFAARSTSLSPLIACCQQARRQTRNSSHATGVQSWEGVQRDEKRERRLAGRPRRAKAWPGSPRLRERKRRQSARDGQRRRLNSGDCQRRWWQDVSAIIQPSAEQAIERRSGSHSQPKPTAPSVMASMSLSRSVS